MFKPDWKLIVSGDAAYEEGVTKYAANAYGVDDLRHLPTTAPDDRAIPGSGWTVARSPNSNGIGSRFIATRVG